MSTLIAVSHPLMSRMHKRAPKLSADQRDKRSVISLEPADYDQWLVGTVVDANQLLSLADVDWFDAAPVVA